MAVPGEREVGGLEEGFVEVESAGKADGAVALGVEGVETGCEVSGEKEEGQVRRTRTRGCLGSRCRRCLGVLCTP